MATEWRIVTNWKNPIQERLEHMLVHGEILITQYLKELSFWNIKNGLDKPQFALKLDCENVENLRIFENRLYVFGYYSIQAIDVTDIHSIRMIDEIQFDRNLVIVSHSMQSSSHVQRCGAVVNGELLFSFFNGVARIQDGVVTMVADMSIRDLKLSIRMRYFTITIFMLSAGVLASAILRSQAMNSSSGKRLKKVIRLQVWCYMGIVRHLFFLEMGIL